MTIADMVATIKYIVQLHNGDQHVTAIGGEVLKDATARTCRSPPTTSTTSATVACARSAS